MVTINILGSVGPLTLLVREDDIVHKVIEISMKLYAKEGCMLVLGYNAKQFELYSANNGTKGNVIPYV